jgi:enoyl-CoA hydratase/carnithine racemase
MRRPRGATLETETEPVAQSRPAAGVALLTLSLPEMRNAMTAEMTVAWDHAVADVMADGDVRAVVLTGAGSAFCSGADLSWLDQGRAHENTPDQLRSKLLPFYRSWLSARDIAVPVIAAVNGPAVGAGLCLALACDVRYAAPTATFSAPFSQIGTHAGLGATWLLREAIGMSRTREMLYTGRTVGAYEAVNWGLASAVADDVVSFAVGMAEKIAHAAPIAVRLTKSTLAQVEHGLEASLRAEALAQAVTLASEDIHEGIDAVRSHRAPDFRGR